MFLFEIKFAILHIILNFNNNKPQKKNQSNPKKKGVGMYSYNLHIT